MVTAWLVIQIVETIFPAFGFGDTAIRTVTIVFAIGLIPTVILAWAFELTPEGLKRDSEVDLTQHIAPHSGKKLDRMILVMLALALSYFAIDKFVLDPARDAEELVTAVEQATEKGRTEAKDEIRDSSITVLAFQDLSPEGDQEYFGDGLAVDLINQLSKVPDLRVTGKTSAFSFKDQDATIPEIGEALNVGHVLEGTVSKAGDRFRISVQLVDTRHDTQLWAQTFDRVLGDIFDIQDQITRAIFDQLTIEFNRLEVESMRTEPGVYDLTLRARHLYHQAGSDDDFKHAADLLAQALAIDPGYVPALLFSVRVNYFLTSIGAISDKEEERIFNEVIRKVLAIDPDNGTALGLVAWADWEGNGRLDLESAARRFSDALKTAPGDLELTRITGMFARSIGRHEQSIALLNRCFASDPLNQDCVFQLAQSYLWGNRLDEALSMHRKLEALTGEKGSFYYVILTLLLQGDATRALTELDSVTNQQDHPQLLAAQAMIMHDLGRFGESEVALERMVGQFTGEFRQEAYLIAEAYAWIGDKAQAFEWLEKAYARDKRYGIQGYWFNRIMFLPIWKKLHGDPRWDELRVRMDLSAERLGKIEFSIPEWILLDNRQF